MILPAKDAVQQVPTRKKTCPVSVEQRGAAHSSFTTRPRRGTRPWRSCLSDHSQAKLDLRCQRIEFLHFDEYRNLSPAKQHYLRRRHHDVCDQIIYELVVHKSNAGGGAAEPVEISFPPWLEARRGALQRPWRGRMGRWWRALRTRLHP